MGDAVSVPVAGPLSVTPLYRYGADLLAWWGSGTWHSVVPGGSAPVVVVTVPASLPAGFAGDVLVRNGTGGALTVNLPPTPVAGQQVWIKDAAGNAGTYGITLQAVFILTDAAGDILTDSHGNVLTVSSAIDGNPSYRLMSDYASVELCWLGDQWGTL